MHRWLRFPGLLIALLALAALAAAACGGGDDNDSAAAGDQAAATATATPAATAQPTAAPRQTATASQPSQAPRPATEIESFRYALTMKVSGDLAGGVLPGAAGSGGSSGDTAFGIESTGEVIAPDREHTTLTAKMGFIELATETIRVGDRVWVREQNGPWQEQTGDAELDFGSFLDPADLIGPEGNPAGLRALLDVVGEGTAERVNGVDAMKYELSETQFAQAFGGGVGDGLLGEGDLGQINGLTITVWVAKDLGIPVRLLMEAEAADAGAQGSFSMELNIFDINSGGIAIEPPA